jgi:penicillin-binding protein 1A
MGITSPLGRNLSLSLGTSELTLMELTSAYTVFPNGGIHVEPILVKRVEDRFGNVLEDHTETPVLEESEIPAPTPRDEFKEQFLQMAHRASQQTGMAAKQASAAHAVSASVTSGQVKMMSQVEGEEDDLLTDPPRAKAVLSPQTAYVMTSLLQGGVRQGTGARLGHYLKRRDLAGKTGTTNNAEDTWFVGFNPDFTTGVWVGFDEKRPLGRREEGARAALPVWAYFMRDILQNRPEREFAIPPQITFKEMLTFPADQKENHVPKMVKEPVYTPFEGLTLVMAPMDLPDSSSLGYNPVAQALLGNQSVLGGPVFGFFPNTSNSSLDPLVQGPQQVIAPPNQQGRTNDRIPLQLPASSLQPPGNLIKPTINAPKGPTRNPELSGRQRSPVSNSGFDAGYR